VQHQVWEDLCVLTDAGRNVVLEFIVYREPPNSLTAYEERLRAQAATFATIGLLPSVDEIMRRMRRRGRSSDLDCIDERRSHAERQRQSLRVQPIASHAVIDPAQFEIDDLVRWSLGILAAGTRDPTPNPDEARQPDRG
jgi:hypothetical protein